MVYKNQWMICNHSVVNLNEVNYKKTKCMTFTKGNHREKLTFKLKNTNIENVIHQTNSGSKSIHYKHAAHALQHGNLVS